MLFSSLSSTFLRLFPTSLIASLTETIPVGPDWLFEMKFDRYRVQIAISGIEVRVYTRNARTEPSSSRSSSIRFGR